MMAYFARKAGKLLLKLLLGVRVHLSMGASPEDLFSDLWNFCRHYKFLFALGEYFPNRFHIPLQNFVFKNILEVVRTKYPAYKPNIRVRTSESISTLFNIEEKIIVVTVHTAISSIIIEILQELGIKSSFVMADASHRQVGVLGYNKIDVILRSQDVFLIARRKLKEGRVICCCVDERSIYNQLYVGIGIFDFAKIIDAKIIFFIPQISDEGEVFIYLAAINNTMEKLSSIDLAQDFVSFINATSEKKKTFEISSWRRENKL
ncbi:MAG: hypothetical protein M3178_12265 [Pseudomonadota bacterium]|nr:hypothetical protein [Pseudomonadota bacterium]